MLTNRIPFWITLVFIFISSIVPQTQIKGVPVIFPEDDVGEITEEEVNKGWRQVFTLDGFKADPDKRADAWYINGNTVNGNGGIWIFEDSSLGVISSTQASGGQGGVGMTRKRYRNFEISLDMNLGWGNDGGIFARTTLNGVAYQSMIDYTDGGNIGALWPEATGESWFNWPFKINSNGRKIDNSTLWFDADDWEKFWRPGQWNHFRWRVEGGEGEKPRTKAWINGIQVAEEAARTDFVPSGKMDDDYRGAIGIQIHQGGRWRGGPNKYKNLRVLELQDEEPFKPVNQCESPRARPYNKDGLCEELLPPVFVQEKKNYNFSTILTDVGDEVKIYSLSGKVEIHFKAKSIGNINLYNKVSQPGLYFVQIKNSNRTITNKLVIK